MVFKQNTNPSNCHCLTNLYVLLLFSMWDTKVIKWKGKGESQQWRGNEKWWAPSKDAKEESKFFKEDIPTSVRFKETFGRSALAFGFPALVFPTALCTTLSGRTHCCNSQKKKMLWCPGSYHHLHTPNSTLAAHKWKFDVKVWICFSILSLKQRLEESISE